jgi:hypothetical protein
MEAGRSPAKAQRRKGAKALEEFIIWNSRIACLLKHQEKETDEEVFTTMDRQRGIQGRAKGSVTGAKQRAESQL